MTRIGDVRGLRAHQFVEDAGPLAHPVRPELYREINNFYTTTVYEKGAEVVRMIHTLLGPDAVPKGMDLYFERHDGEAATVEQFVQCFADVNKRDLKQFMRWYSQAGTPEVVASGHYDAAAKTYRLDLAQTIPPTPGQPSKEPMVIPLAIGLVGQDGRDLPLTLAGGHTLDRGVWCSTRPRKSFVFTGVTERPVLSINRDFSAPVKLTANVSADDLRLLAAHDSDPFNRWQAVQTLATRAARRQRGAAARRPGSRGRRGTAQCARRDPRRQDARAGIRGRSRSVLPSEADIAREIGRDVDPDAIFRARAALRALIGLHLNAALTATLSEAWPACGRTARTRPAPGAARSRTSASICWPATQESRRDPPRGAAVRDRRQHDRPDGGAVDAFAARCAPNARPRSTISTSATATIRSSSTNGSRCRP